ncbi:uncharacterized protein L969DRAFT_105336 [Mixia osmundae IAM 14324]|uniref:Uncharacterized protein n=1 Tax=Mixia osmundae (strain CBS 9802 / IAM 14324 / JCM 22182 / KY 12970) TaxID=764103 RepID=G7EB18_MIXOS|nr:uncharacterized protein L969DRAFT_105336 [Mixia osmundae IAM 14324]KEI37062.1 hypothetical protein L969DRAFT_105336 [Mixia osmundae IAM 14324]GAB00029.1 hypothetical protein E5Q_06731 [Mixia osmundae IAM 14324]
MECHAGLVQAKESRDRGQPSATLANKSLLLHALLSHRLQCISDPVSAAFHSYKLCQGYCLLCETLMRRPVFTAVSKSADQSDGRGKQWPD